MSYVAQLEVTVWALMIGLLVMAALVVLLNGS